MDSLNRSILNRLYFKTGVTSRKSINQGEHACVLVQETLQRTVQLLRIGLEDIQVDKPMSKTSAVDIIVRKYTTLMRRTIFPVHTLELHTPPDESVQVRL